MFFSREESLDFRTNGILEDELLRISNRYIADNPPDDFVYRMYDGANFVYRKDCGYDLNLRERFPNAPLGSWGYICTKTVRYEDFSPNVIVSCYSPVEIFCNGEKVYSSSVAESVDYKISALVNLPLKKGDNTLFIKTRAVKSGFGCRIAAQNTGWGWIQWLSPFGQYGGFAYSEPVSWDVVGNEIPGVSDDNREEFPFKWFPEVPSVVSNCDFSKMFAFEQTGWLYGWSSVSVSRIEGKTLELMISATDKVRVWIGNQEVVLHREGEKILGEINLCYGKHDVLVAYEYKTELDFSISANEEFIKPYPVLGLKGTWLFSGPFAEPIGMFENKLHRLFKCVDGSKCFWRGNDKKGFVRPCLESEHYGKWTYPIGVTLYGLIRVARSLNREDLLRYAKQHVDLCVKLYRYSIWDMNLFGHPEINNEILRMELLDDCGSFGATMLEAYSEENAEYVSFLAGKIAEYITEKNARRADGALYRVRKNNYVDNTLWADDLYMSVPFLCRYYRLTGESKYLEFAAQQFLLFKKYLFMPEHKIMSHVYDFNYQTSNGIPWGRGNGWVLFSLAELLQTLPADSCSRETLLDFYQELSRGYLVLQGENGLWHQVLTDSESYEETSCTSMFVYAFSKGILNKWYPEEEASVYLKAAEKGWKGITQRMTDRYGNVFGVCRGSGYSFLHDYYKKELKPIKNDVHGIGIVLLAGVALREILEKVNNKE